MSVSETQAAPAVALLARPGAARERLREALSHADVQLVLEDDPNTLEARVLQEARPQFVVIALEAAIEDALERLEAVLSAPGLTLVFDEAELAALNAKIVHQLDFASVAERLPAGVGAAEWEAVRPNLSTVAEAADWWKVIEGRIDAVRDPADADFLAAAARHVATMPWDADPWHALTAALKAETGRSGKALFLPLRRALTGLDHGPDMAALLPLIGRDRALARKSQRKHAVANRAPKIRDRPLHSEAYRVHEAADREQQQRRASGL